MNLFEQEYANIVEMLIKKEKERKKIISDSKYISWLENFTLENPNFCDDDWLYFPEKISEKDRECVSKLHLLYDSIEIYGKENYIYPNPIDFGGLYCIKYNGVGYEIGKMVGQGTVTFCQRVEIEQEEQFIDFDDILNNKKQKNTDSIKNRLDTLSNLIKALVKDNIPWQAVEETIKKTITEISESSENEEIDI